MAAGHRHSTGAERPGAERSAAGAVAPGSQWLRDCPNPQVRQVWGFIDALANAGGGKRDEVIYAALRDPDGVSSAVGYNFTGGLTALLPAYDNLVASDSAAALDDVEKASGKDMAIASGLQILAGLDKLYASIASQSDNPAARTEMLSAIVKRQGEVQGKIRVLRGGKPGELSRQEAVDKYKMYVGLCSENKTTAADYFTELEAVYAGGKKPSSLGEVTEHGERIKKLSDIYAQWNRNYDELAALAQEHGFDKHEYWRFKPDMARYNRALIGPPGPESEPKPETANKRKYVPQAITRGVPEAFKDVDAMVETAGDDIRRRIPPTRRTASRLYNKLTAALDPNRKGYEMALYAHNRGREKFNSAESELKKIPPNATGDAFTSYGSVVLQDYNAAIGHFKDGLARYGIYV